MEWSRAALKEHAKRELRYSYWLSVGVSLANMALAALATIPTYIVAFVSVLSPLAALGLGRQFPFDGMEAFVAAVGGWSLLASIFAFLFTLFVTNVLEVGKTRFFIQAPRGERDFSLLFSAFKRNYKNAFVTMFLVQLFTSLWSLLLIIPGIIKSYEYRMIPYLLADNPDMGWREAFAKSKEMTYGHKWDMFVLDLSFLGWMILLGIAVSMVTAVFPPLGALASFGTVFLLPYIEATWAQLYFVLSGQPEDQSQEPYREVI